MYDLIWYLLELKLIRHLCYRLIRVAPQTGPQPGRGLAPLPLWVNGKPFAQGPAGFGKQVASSDLHLSCAEGWTGQGDPLRRLSSASLGTKGGESQEDKGGRSAKSRRTAFEVRHLRGEENVAMGANVGGHLDHNTIQRFWRFVTYCFKWSTCSGPWALTNWTPGEPLT